MGNNTFERVPLYLPYHHFINLISADLEQKLLDETEFDFFYAKLSFKEGYALE